MLTADLIVATVGACGLLISILMMFFTKIYLNKSRRRARFIALIWGDDNEWYRGRHFDFVIANFVIPGSVVAACWLRSRFRAGKQLTSSIYVFPELHLNENYKHLLSEFGFFCFWEAAKAVVIFSSLLCGFFLIGIDNGWWLGFL